MGNDTREVLFTKEEILSIFGWYFSMRPFMGTQFLDPLLDHLSKDSYPLTELLDISHDWFRYEPFVYDAIETYSGWDISFLDDEISDTGEAGTVPEKVPTDSAGKCSAVLQEREEGGAGTSRGPSDPLFYLVSRAVNYVNVELNEKDWQIFQVFSDVFAQFSRDLVASCENGTVSLHHTYNHFRQAVALVQELQAEILETQGYDRDAALKFLHSVKFPAYETIFPTPKAHATLKELLDWDAVDGPYSVTKDVMQVFFLKLPTMDGGSKVDASFLDGTYLQELKDAVVAVEPVPTAFDEGRFNKIDNLNMKERRIVGSHCIGRQELSFYNDFKKAYKEFKDNYRPLQDSKPCDPRTCITAHRLGNLFDEGQKLFPDGSVKWPEFANALTLWTRFKTECVIKRGRNEQEFFNKFSLSARSGSGGRRQETELYRFLDTQLSRYYDFGPESSTVRRQLGKVINTWWGRIVFSYRYNDKNEIRDIGSDITENFFSDLKFVGNMAKHLGLLSFPAALEFDWIGPSSPLTGRFQEHIGKSWQFFIENSIKLKDKKDDDGKAYYFTEKKGTSQAFKPGQILFELIYLYWLLSVHFRAGDDWAGLTRCILLFAGFNGSADDLVLLDSK